MKFPWTLILCSLVITGCTSMCSGGNRKEQTPEQVVEAYLDVALNMKSVDEREQLVQFTTGNLKAAIEAASPETIKAAYVDRRYNLLNYSVVERRDRTPRETEVTFQLTYNDLGADLKNAKDAPKVTTENTVSVVRENGVWYIRDVLGNKTSIDFPVSEESRITAKAGGGASAPKEPEPEPEPLEEDLPQEAEGDEGDAATQ